VEFMAWKTRVEVGGMLMKSHPACPDSARFATNQLCAVSTREPASNRIFNEIKGESGTREQQEKENGSPISCPYFISS